MPLQTNERTIGTHPNKLINSTSTNSGENFLFAVGISEYKYCRKLPNAVKDVQDLIKLLTTKYRFETKNIFTLFNESATSEAIHDEFAKLTHILRPDDSLIIYFSGHGDFQDTFNEGYWVPVEAHPNKTNEYLPNSTIKTILAAFEDKCRHIFLVSDSCFSGTLFNESSRLIQTEPLERDPSRYGLTSGRNEPVSDGAVGKNSPFAKYLIYTLQNNDDSIGVAELSNKVTQLVVDNAESDQRPRWDSLRGVGHKGGQFFFHLRNDESADWLETQNADSILAYRSFLQKYPESIHVQEVQTKINFLEEESIWQKATTVNSIKAFDDYISKYPRGKFRRDAVNKMESLEEQQYYNKAVSSDTLSVYRNFLYKYPESVLATDVENRIKKIRGDEQELENKIVQDAEATRLKVEEERKKQNEKRAIESRKEDEKGRLAFEKNKAQEAELKKLQTGNLKPIANVTKPKIDKPALLALEKEKIATEAVSDFKIQSIVWIVLAAFLTGSVIVYKWVCNKVEPMVKKEAEHLMTPSKGTDTTITIFGVPANNAGNKQNPYNRPAENKEKEYEPNRIRDFGKLIDKKEIHLPSAPVLGVQKAKERILNLKLLDTAKSTIKY